MVMSNGWGGLVLVYWKGLFSDFYSAAFIHKKADSWSAFQALH